MADTFDWLDFWYQNKAKIDSLVSQLNGRLESEHTETVSKSVGGGGKLGIELGGLLASLGLAKGTAEAELHSDYEKISEVTSSLSPDNKVILMTSFLERDGQLTAVPLFDLEPAELLEAVRKSRFQLLMGGFTYVEDDDGKIELRSALAGGGEPLVRVPVLAEHMTPTQMIGVLSEGEVFAHHVFCTSMVRQGWIVASPIAIWFPKVDVDSELVQWWGGRETQRLDTATGVPASE